MSAVTMRPAALLVCIEGIDGAGKSTLAARLVERLTARGVSVSTVHGQSIAPLSLADEDPLERTTALDVQDRAFAAYSRLHRQFETCVQPALAGHQLVVLDRYRWSHLVRWGCRGVSWPVLCSLMDGFGLLPAPDLTLYLQADPREALARKQRAGLPLTRNETGLDDDEAGGADDAFVEMQGRATRYYDDLMRRAAPGTMHILDSTTGAVAVAERALAILDDALSGRACPRP